MTHFDAFNGDADGICALHQLRLAEPKDAVLVSGVKRDIALLQRIDAHAGDSVTALDISVAENRPALVALLERGVRVEYFDHHFAGDVPVHPNLRAVLDPSPRTCTGMLVDRHLGGRYRVWAVVAAFGDNLAPEALAIAADLALDAAQLDALRDLGEALAYNAYGDTEADLVMHPVELYRLVHRHADPFAFMRTEPIFATLCASRHDDLALAHGITPAYVLSGASIYVLPDAAWSRRVRGAFANELALASPGRAHAVLTPNASGGLTASIRAPIRGGTGADVLCRRFPSGSGRAAAAGINDLPADRLPALAHEMARTYP
ncbi:MAG: hypothetical protein ACM3JC_09050 [Rudaea sp.]